jgi:hypothetical protein
MKYLLPVLMLAPLFASGCHNSCQQICNTMKKYADECGVEVQNSELSACFERQAGKASRDNRSVCREFGDMDSIQQEWSCADVEEYWQVDAPEDDGSSE